MSPPVEAVTDANVWIDLRHGGLIPAAFALDVTWAAPDIVVRHELRSPLGTGLLRRGLLELTLSPAEISAALALRRAYGGISAADAMTLALAESRQMILVTGDGPLRRAAKGQDVRHHGVLWVLDLLVSAQIVGQRVAAEALAQMKEQGGRFPQEEVKKRLEGWGHGP